MCFKHYVYINLHIAVYEFILIWTCIHLCITHRLWEARWECRRRWRYYAQIQMCVVIYEYRPIWISLSLSIYIYICIYNAPFVRLPSGSPLIMSAALALLRTNTDVYSYLWVHTYMDLSLSLYIYVYIYNAPFMRLPRGSPLIMSAALALLCMNKYAYIYEYTPIWTCIHK